MDEDHEDTHQELLFTPVREAACGVALRMFRDRDGSRCAVAFTTEDRLRTVLGADQRWVPLAEPALRELTRPLGVASLVVDPNLVAPAVPAAVEQAAPARESAARQAVERHYWDPALVGPLRVAAAVGAAGAADLLIHLLP